MAQAVEIRGDRSMIQEDQADATGGRIRYGAALATEYAISFKASVACLSGLLTGA